MSLVPLPPVGPDSVWPGGEWTVADAPECDTDRLEAELDRWFSRAETPELGASLAFVAVRAGRIVSERYGPDTRPTTTLLSWSVAKSVTQLALGVLVADGLLDPDAAAAVPEWSEDPRSAITVTDLLRMRSGLAFVEDYVDDSVSDCLEMLWGTGADDVAGYAATRRAEHPPGTHFNYSSGTTNVLSRLLGDAVAGGSRRSNRTDTERFLTERVLHPLGMHSASLRFDAAGTWVGSSYLYATARDYARFGLCCLRGGRWSTGPLVPEGWMDRARTRRSVDPELGWGYGEHWWVRDDAHGTFWANGYDGQVILCVPALDLVVVRLGRTPVDLRSNLWAFLDEVVDCFGPAPES